MTDEQRKTLEARLWDIANTLRGKMNADEFRDYILGFIFFKYLSERMTLFANNALQYDNIRYRDVDETSDVGSQIIAALQAEALETLGYFLKPSQLFHVVAARGASGEFILGELEEILKAIEKSTLNVESQEDFDHLFEDIDLGSTKLGKTEAAKNELISKVLIHLDGIDFRLDDADSDILGDAYEYLIGQFASGAGKKAGEFYTPQAVSTILARIVTTGKTRLKNAYDPSCGSGSLLLRVAKEVKDVSNFYGQEMNRTTFNLARMNMILHGVHYRNFDIKQDDTLESPQHLDLQFEAIVANPPFSAKWSARNAFLSDDRFSEYGRLAPASKADFAFVTHMLHHLADNGTMAVVLPHGALFRGGAEGEIREFIIREKNWLDAVIGLPAGIFYGTGIPTCILVFKKCRQADEVLFIDASACFAKGKNENTLTDRNVTAIVGAYQGRILEEGFSRSIKVSDIAANGYNLNIARYVTSVKTEPSIDLTGIARKIKATSEKIKTSDKLIIDFCNDLGVEAPV